MKGIKVLLHEAFGCDTQDPSKYYGKKIVLASFEGKEIKLGFDDDLKIRISDEGQSCCEDRYITTDDDIKFLVGKNLKHMEIKDGIHGRQDGGDPHETAFLEIMTDQGCVTFTTHVEHNGYYGGFSICIQEMV